MEQFLDDPGAKRCWTTPPIAMRSDAVILATTRR